MLNSSENFEMDILQEGGPAPGYLINPHMGDQATALLDINGIALTLAFSNITKGELKRYQKSGKKTQHIGIADLNGLIIFTWNRMDTHIWNDFIVHPINAQPGYDIDEVSNMPEDMGLGIRSFLIDRRKMKICSMGAFATSNLFARTFVERYKKYQKETITAGEFNHRIAKLYEKYPSPKEIFNDSLVQYQIGSQDEKISIASTSTLR